MAPVDPNFPADDPPAQRFGRKDSLDSGRGGPNPLGESSGDPPPSADPARRHGAMTVAVFLIAVIVAFLIWFVASNARRTENSGYFGMGGTVSAEVVAFVEREVGGFQ